jgi:Domain of unknown function (DUF4258)
MDCKKIMIGEHSFRRMFEREISPDDVLSVVRKGEIIKEYPDDKPYPSFLILKFVNNKPVHIVVAKNNENNFCFVITVYEPDPTMWSKDFKNKLYE